jgi:NAD(P)-dependent dehydrogenase (short-subunit alcohol dehydrogenase family)
MGGRLQNECDWVRVYCKLDLSTEVDHAPHFSYFFTTAAFMPLLSAASKTRKGFTSGVINITSMSGITRTSQHHFKYNVSKAAAIHLNTLLAQELCRPGEVFQFTRFAESHTP